VELFLHVGLSNAFMATALALLVGLVSLFCRRPALLHSLWLLVLLKLVTPPFVEVAIPWPESRSTLTAETATRDRVPTEEKPPAASNAGTPSQVSDNSVPEIASAPLVTDTGLLPLDSDLDILPPIDSVTVAPERAPVFLSPLEVSWTTVMAAVWAAGSGFWLFLITLRVHRFQCSLRCAVPAPEAIASQVRQLAMRLGLARPPRVWLVPGRIAPMLWTLGKTPGLYLPAALWQRLDAVQQATVLTHELAHLRRRDHWVRILEVAATALYWWHPVVWWACREIREQEERCCDAWVVWSLPDAVRAYATALIETVEFLSETGARLPAVASGIGPVPNLRRRVTMIMRGRTPRALSELGFVAMLGFGAILLPLVPSWAQQPGSTTPPAVAPAGADPFSDAQPPGAPAVARFALQDDGRDDGTRQAQDEIRQLTEQIRNLQRQMDNANRRLQRAHDRLAEQERNLSRRDAGPRPVTAETPRRRPGGGNTEDRLAQLERKLDAVLEEMQSLRREMRRGRGGMGGIGGGMPGMPGMGGMGGMPGMPGMQPGPGNALPPGAPGGHQPGPHGNFPGQPGQPPPATTSEPPSNALPGAAPLPPATSSADTAPIAPSVPTPAVSPVPPAGVAPVNAAPTPPATTPAPAAAPVPRTPSAAPSRN
jgi:bla regulator protein blaR1